MWIGDTLGLCRTRLRHVQLQRPKVHITDLTGLHLLRNAEMALGGMALVGFLRNFRICNFLIWLHYICLSNLLAAIAGNAAYVGTSPFPGQTMAGVRLEGTAGIEPWRSLEVIPWGMQLHTLSCHWFAPLAIWRSGEGWPSKCLWPLRVASKWRFFDLIFSTHKVSRNPSERPMPRDV